MNRRLAETLAQAVIDEIAKKLSLPYRPPGALEIPYLGALHVVVIPSNGRTESALQGIWVPTYETFPFISSFLTPELSGPADVKEWLSDVQLQLGIAARSRVLDVFSRPRVWDTKAVAAWIKTASKLLDLPFLWAFWDGDPLIPSGIWKASTASDHFFTEIQIGSSNGQYYVKVSDVLGAHMNICTSPEMANAWLMSRLTCPELPWLK